jgi:hypothetical protein
LGIDSISISKSSKRGMIKSMLLFEHTVCPYNVGESSTWIELVQRAINADPSGVWSESDTKAWNLLMLNRLYSDLASLIELPSNWCFPETMFLHTPL